MLSPDHTEQDPYKRKIAGLPWVCLFPLREHTVKIWPPAIPKDRPGKNQKPPRKFVLQFPTSTAVRTHKSLLFKFPVCGRQNRLRQAHYGHVGSLSQRNGYKTVWCSKEKCVTEKSLASSGPKTLFKFFPDSWWRHCRSRFFKPTFSTCSQRAGQHRLNPTARH